MIIKLYVTDIKKSVEIAKTFKDYQVTFACYGFAIIKTPVNVIELKAI